MQGSFELVYVTHWWEYLKAIREPYNASIIKVSHVWEDMSDRMPPAQRADEASRVLRILDDHAKAVAVWHQSHALLHQQTYARITDILGQAMLLQSADELVKGVK